MLRPEFWLSKVVPPSFSHTLTYKFPELFELRLRTF